MADQLITFTVRQRHSGGPLRVTERWTSDGVVVVDRSRTVRISADDHGLDSHLFVGATQSAQAAVKAWALQLTLF